MKALKAFLEAKGMEEHGGAARDSPTESNVLQELGNGHDLDARAKEEETEIRLSETLEVGGRSSNGPLVHIKALKAYAIAFLLEGEGRGDLDDLGRRVKDGNTNGIVSRQQDGTQCAAGSNVDCSREGSTDNETEERGIGAVKYGDGHIVREEKASNRKSSENTSQVAASKVSRLGNKDTPLAEASVYEDLHGVEINDESSKRTNLTNDECIVTQKLLLEVGSNEAIRDAKNESYGPTRENVLQGVSSEIKTAPRECQGPSDCQRNPPHQERG